VSRFTQSTSNALKLLLWLQLLLRGQWRLLARYYALVWIVAGGLVGLSVWMLVQPNGPPKPIALPSAVVALVSVAIMLLAYILTRSVGTLSVVLLALALPGTIVITPSVQSNQFGRVEEEAEDGGLTTGDLSLFAKGAGTCGVLGVVAAVTWWGALSLRRWHWSPRQVVAISMLVSGLLALELLRIATHPLPDVQAFWEPGMAVFLAEPGWSYALSVWLWLATGHFLALYDIIIIPHLLRRHGQTWVKHDLRLHETYMVDTLLDEIAAGDGMRKGRTHS